jgi:microcystin-dependent protein
MKKIRRLIKRPVIKKLLVSLLICVPSILLSNVAIAEEPYLGEMAYFAGNFAPRGWALCDGQLLPISQNTALFSLLGTIYGGDGRTTFGLPDMRGRALVHTGSGPGLTPRSQGSKFGNETVTMSVAQLPSHNHSVNSTADTTIDATANGKALASVKMYKAGSTPNKLLNSATVGNAGASQPINTIQPTLAIHCIIAIQGIFPTRN